MKTRMITSLAVLLTALTLFAADPVGVTSQIKEVTVFLQGAQISRQARINIAKGSSTLILRDLPVDIDPRSIQARGEGNFVILSLLHQVNYLAGAQKISRDTGTAGYIKDAGK